MARILRRVPSAETGGMEAVSATVGSPDTVSTPVADGGFAYRLNPAATAESSRSDRLDAAAARLTLPVLLVRGGRSELVTMDNANDFLKRVPHARFSDVSEAGHMVVGDNNDAFADAVIGFIDQLVD